jgi:pimeloyl-ACP methyl ester carboxylesterase
MNGADVDTVTSLDGTPIAFELGGDGEPIIFAHGVFNDHSTCAPLAELLQHQHTVVTYDRRGRGESGDSLPYAVDREVEDLAALIEKVGGAAAVFGYSSGGVLALRAAADGLPITHLALYEPPFVVGEDVVTARPADRPAVLANLVAGGRPGDAVAKFQIEHLGLPPEMVTQIRQSPMWAGLEAMAASMIYDCTITTEYPVPTQAMVAVTTPTLVISGALTWPHLAGAAAHLASAMPAAHHVQVDGGENHTIPPEATAAAVDRFLRR